MANRKTLFIVRHAKSSWDIENISDIDRPLKFRGIRDAYDMARRVKINRLIPDLIVTSPANRAMHTASIFQRVFEIESNSFKVDDRLFCTSVVVMERLVSLLDDSYKRAMIFGHNPYFSELASMLSGDATIELPTCGICRIDFEINSWKDISKDKVIDTFVDYPKKGIEES